MDNYQELPISCLGIDIDEVQAFIDRAKRAGHNAVEVRFDHGYYDEVENLRLLSSFDRSVEYRRITQNTKP